MNWDFKTFLSSPKSITHVSEDLMSLPCISKLFSLHDCFLQFFSFYSFVQVQKLVKRKCNIFQLFLAENVEPKPGPVYKYTQ